MKSAAYPPLDGLVDLACRDGVDVRPTLLRVLTDLYVQKTTHSSDEVTQYIELALGLVDTVDDATRAAVAASLSRYPAAPAAVLAKLGVSAAPAPAPATKVAPEIEAIQTIAAEDIDTSSLVDLFFSASSEDRRIILLNLDAAAGPVPRTRPVTAEVLKHIENVALQRKSAEFSRALSNALNVPRTLAERIARDPSGEPIVVAAKALGMKAAVLQRILLFLNPAVGQSIQRVYDLADLFDALSRDAAEVMLAIWRQDGQATAPAHEPVYSDNHSRNVRTQGTKRNVRAGEAQTERLKSAR
jgi:hypothetical protein